ncbi:hypothetical protein DMA14_21300 [Flavobacterium sharifuzzamanii]|nr:hypothetical protein DMA14_21300 [Flavobacterium sharifuzzamanii]
MRKIRKIMNRLAYLAFGPLFLSCNIKEPIAIKENISDQMVLIDPGIKNHITKDSVPITIPVEFEIKQTTSNLRQLDLYFVSINGKRLLDYGVDFQTYDKENPTKFSYFSLKENDLGFQKKNNIIVRISTQMVSRAKAVEFIQKYNPNRLLEDINKKGNIQLTTYKQFRKDNPDLIEGFRKVNGSVVFSVSLKGGERAHISQKINW